MRDQNEIQKAAKKMLYIHEKKMSWELASCRPRRCGEIKTNREDPSLQDEFAERARSRIRQMNRRWILGLNIEVHSTLEVHGAQLGASQVPSKGHS